MTVYRDLKVTLQPEGGFPGQLFILYGKADGNEVRWSGATRVTRAAYRFTVETPSPDAEPEVRLLYWFRFLGSSDEQIVKDTLTEIGRTDFRHHRELVSHLPRDDLRRAFRNLVASDGHRALYAKLLGLCGDESDVAMLEDAMRQHLVDGKEYVASFDGIVAGYLLLEDTDGL